MAANSTRQWIPLQKQLFPLIKEPVTAYQKNAKRKHQETIDTALKRGFIKCLDQELILHSQAESETVKELEDVLRISLNCANVQALDEIAILSCTRLRICNLGSCYVRDITAFYGSVNLLKLDLSNNQISQLPRSDFWSSLSSLRVLYLHGNGLSGRQALSYLNACKTLHILTLHDTPLSLIKRYRHHVVNSILSLKALDYHVISDEEIIENLTLFGSFRPLSKHFKLQLYMSPRKGLTYVDEIRGVYRVLLAVDRILAKHSPVILLQRCIRGWLLRRALTKSANQKIRSLAAKIQKHSTRCKSKQQSPHKNLELSSGLVITAEIPLSTQSKKSFLTKKSQLKSLPPPPPSTSPLHQGITTPCPVERHVIGIDEKSSQAKYFMHINLRQLQQTVNEAELMEPEGVDKHFRSAFMKTFQKGKNKHSGDDDQNKLSSHNSIFKSNDTPENLRLSLSEERREELNAQMDGAQVSGLPISIQTRDQRPNLSEVNKKNGIEIREAEMEILKVATKLREPPKITNKTNISAKDELLFIRAAATMTLSTLQSVEQEHLARKKSDKLKEKKLLVSKVKNERTTRKAKVDEFHENIREQARDWKNQEDHKLEEQRAKQAEKRNSTLLKQSEIYDLSMERKIEQLQNQHFAQEFGIQNTMVGCTLQKEDYKALKETETIDKRDVVREARVEAQDKQEMVKRFMDLRRRKLLKEGEEARKKLDSKMLEAASNRLISSRRRIDREIARKKAAREAIAAAREELRKGPPRPGHELPSNQGAPIVTDCEYQHVQFSPIHARPVYKSPPRVRRGSRDAHSTWQRGSRVLDSLSESGHFPLISSASETPLMYGMMQPRTPRTSLTIDLPDIESEMSSSRSTTSMATTTQLSVR